eukprot:TRINITY_DN62283_c0_g1_i1.p1 TRINITY_DN62283_c0_g1~~TRINITY_DN62283_c0_g1_i1.p1  ORF type:complete len:347 (+),score=56.26 TRINITY_DN62283_c0_g1_i1:144-1184(+)
MMSQLTNVGLQRYLPQMLGAAWSGTFRGACRDGYEACALAFADNPRKLEAIFQASRFLGESRCLELRVSCRRCKNGLRVDSRRAICEPPAPPALAPPSQTPSPCVSTGEPTDADPPATQFSARDELVKALGAPSFRSPASLTTEDAVYVLLADVNLEAQIPSMLSAHAPIHEHKDIRRMLAELRPLCQVPGDVLDVIFQPQVERDRTLFFNPRAIHLAVVHSSARIVGLLLGAARRVGALEEVLQQQCSIQRRSSSSPSTLTPLFVAALFAGREVVDRLVRAGCEPNDIDVHAAGLLRRRGHWNPVKERMQALGMESTAARIEVRLAEKQAERTKYRASLRRILIS